VVRAKPPSPIEAIMDNELQPEQIIAMRSGAMLLRKVEQNCDIG